MVDVHDIHATLRAEQERLERDDLGNVHPFFSWKPQTRKFIGNKAIRWKDSQGEWHDGLEFQETLSTSKAFMVGAVTATGSGKTTWLVHRVSSRFCHFDPAFPELAWPNPQSIYLCSERRVIPDLFQRLVQHIPKEFVSRIHWATGNQAIFGHDGSYIRMMSYDLPREAFQSVELDLVAMDEEPPHHFWEEAMRRLRKPGSQVIMGCTTLRGAMFVHDEFEQFPPIDRNAQSGDRAWATAPMYANPNLPKDYVEREKKRHAKDPDMYAITIEGEPRCLQGRFIFSGEMLEEHFRRSCEPEKWVRMADRGGIPHDGPLSWAIWQEPIPGHRYVLFSDLAGGGLEGDFTAAHILDVDTGEQVARFHGRISPGPFAGDCARAARWYNVALLNFEKNYGGHAFLDRLRSLGYPRICRSENMSGKIQTDLQAYGFRTDGNSKHILISNLRDAVSDNRISIYDDSTLNELSRFGWLRKEDGKGRSYGMGALSGHDDLAMSLAGAWYTARRPEALKRQGRYRPEKPEWQQLEEEAMAEARREEKMERMLSRY